MDDRKELLNKLFDSTLKELTARIKSGDATTGDISNALKLLKDNGITIDVRPGNPLSLLAADIEELPDFQ